MDSTNIAGKFGWVVDTTTWGLGITYDHEMDVFFGMMKASFITISILCFHILIVIKEEPNNG